MAEKPGTCGRLSLILDSALLERGQLHTRLGSGLASKLRPRRPHHPAPATGARSGAGSSLRLFSFLAFLFKEKGSKGSAIWARTPSLFGFVQGFLFIYLFTYFFTFIYFVSVISSRHDPRLRRHAGSIAATERATTGRGGAGRPGR